MTTNDSALNALSNALTAADSPLPMALAEIRTDAICLAGLSFTRVNSVTRRPKGRGPTANQESRSNWTAKPGQLHQVCWLQLQPKISRLVWVRER